MGKGAGKQTGQIVVAISLALEFAQELPGGWEAASNRVRTYNGSSLTPFPHLSSRPVSLCWDGWMNKLMPSSEGCRS